MRLTADWMEWIGFGLVCFGNYILGSKSQGSLPSDNESQDRIDCRSNLDGHRIVPVIPRLAQSISNSNFIIQIGHV